MPPKPKPSAKPNAKKVLYCEEHGVNSSHVTRDCYVLKRKREGKDVNKGTCAICEGDHSLKDCPLFTQCIDVDKATGKFKPRARVCFNCGRRGCKPKDCPYEWVLSRIIQTGKDFFQALRDGKTWIEPPLPPSSQLRKKHKRNPNEDVNVDASMVNDLSIIVSGVSDWDNTEMEHIKERADGYTNITIENGNVVAGFDTVDARQNATSLLTGSVTSNGDTLSVQFPPELPSHDPFVRALTQPSSVESSSASSSSPMDTLLDKLDGRLESRLKIAMDDQITKLTKSFDGIQKSLENLNNRMEVQEKKQKENADAICDLQGRIPGTGRVTEAWNTRTSKTRDTGAHVWAVVGVGDEARVMKARVMHTVEQNVGGKRTQGAQVQEVNDEDVPVSKNIVIDNDHMFDTFEEAKPTLQRATVTKRTRTHVTK